MNGLGLRRSVCAACVSIGLALPWGGSTLGAAGLGERLTPSYRGTPYDRFTIPAAAYGRASRAQSLPVAGVPPRGLRYAIVGLGTRPATVADGTRLPLGINRQGRILLDDYRPGPDGGVLGGATVVDADGTSAALRAECPA